MRKHGFTLAEILVSLGIVGVIGAVTIPSLINSRPDEKKATVLKTHKIISETIRDILDDPSLYIDACQNQNPYIACNAIPVNPKLATNNSQHNYNSNYYRDKGRLLSRILTERLDSRNGQQWTHDSIERGEANIKLTDANAIFQYNGGEPTITIELPTANNETICSFGENNCTNPKRFIFDVSSNGRVTGHDALTKAYLRNPHKLNDTKKDLEVAQEIWDKENSQ